MNHKYQLKMLVQNMTQVKPRSPAITQRLLEHDLTRLNGLTIELIIYPTRYRSGRSEYQGLGARLDQRKRKLMATYNDDLIQQKIHRYLNEENDSTRLAVWLSLLMCSV